MEDNFDDEGLELESWTPEDWTPNPEFIGKLKKPALRGLAKRINRLWKDLSRKIKEDVKAHPSLYSIIYVPNGFIVPGGEDSFNLDFNNRLDSLMLHAQKCCDVSTVQNRFYSLNFLLAIIVKMDKTWKCCNFWVSAMTFFIGAINE